MKPANFPARKKLRIARLMAHQAGLHFPGRAFDRGAAATEAEAEQLLSDAEHALGRQ